MSSVWDGKSERRSQPSVMNEKDHDLLIEINANLKNLMGNHTQHLLDDAKQFASLDVRMSSLEKTKWIQSGVLIAVMLALKFLFKV